MDEILKVYLVLKEMALRPDMCSSKNSVHARVKSILIFFYCGIKIS